MVGSVGFTIFPLLGTRHVWANDGIHLLTIHGLIHDHGNAAEPSSTTAKIADASDPYAVRERSRAVFHDEGTPTHYTYRTRSDASLGLYLAVMHHIGDGDGMPEAPLLMIPKVGRGMGLKCVHQSMKPLNDGHSLHAKTDCAIHLRQVCNHLHDEDAVPVAVSSIPDRYPAMARCANTSGFEVVMGSHLAAMRKVRRCAAYEYATSVCSSRLIGEGSGIRTDHSSVMCGGAVFRPPSIKGNIDDAYLQVTHNAHEVCLAIADERIDTGPVRGSPFADEAVCPKLHIGIGIPVPDERGQGMANVFDMQEDLSPGHFVLDVRGVSPMPLIVARLIEMPVAPIGPIAALRDTRMVGEV